MKHLVKKEEARALIRERLVLSADIIPDDKEKTLTIHVHHMTSRVHILKRYENYLLN